MTATPAATTAESAATDDRDRMTRLVDTLQRWPYLDTVVTLRQRFREDRLGLTAGSLTFTTLISLVPLVTVMLAAFAAFPMFATLQDALQKYFLQSLVPDAIARPVLGALTQFSSKASRLGIVGVVALFGSALALMLTIDRTLNAIWRVRTPRPIAQRVLVYWAAVTLGPVLLGSSLSLTSYAVSASRGFVGALPGGVGLLLGTIEFILVSIGMAGLFHYVPNTQVQWRHALAGGVFVAAGFEIAKRLLAWYLVLVPSYAMVYGAFATVPIFLIWIYLSWVIVLLGAVVAAYAPSLQMRVMRWPDGPGARFQLALAVLRELDAVRTHERKGVSNAAISEALRTDPLQTDPILESLVALDWVGRLDEEGDARYVLLCDPAHTAAEPLVSLLLIQPMSTLRAFWQRAGFAEMTVHDLIAR
ncbi:MAG: YihY family inner membrane protein [Caldimonas sp.]